MDGLPDGLGEVPAVSEKVMETDLQPLGTGGQPERAAEGMVEEPRLLERDQEPGGGLAVGVDPIVFGVVGLRPGAGSSAMSAAKTRFVPIRWLTSRASE